MLFQSYLFTVYLDRINKENWGPSRLVEEFIGKHLRNEGYEVAIVGNLGWFETCKNYPKNTQQVAMCCFGSNPPDLDRFLDKLKGLIILDSMPSGFKFTDAEIVEYFHSEPMILILSEYQTDYKKFALNTLWLKCRYPELYEKLIGPELRLNF